MTELIISQVVNGLVWGLILGAYFHRAHPHLRAVGNRERGPQRSLNSGRCGGLLFVRLDGGMGFLPYYVAAGAGFAGTDHLSDDHSVCIGKPPIVTVIITYGILFILEQIVFLTYGGVPRSIPNPIPYNIPFIGGDYPLYRVFCAVFSGLVIFGLMIFLKWTRYGLWTRATKQDYETAMNMGIPVRRVYAFVFLSRLGTCRIGGALAAPISPVTFTMGHSIIIDAFIVVIMAGFGSVIGTLVASLVIEVVIGVSAAFVNPVMAKVIGMALMVVVLFIRPQGLFGEE